uniref:Uncharacterized protein n=1 Tax=Wuchereria bancrofti TaxID=6293 RepID=A0A1I8EXQ4_WUCBA
MLAFYFQKSKIACQINVVMKKFFANSSFLSLEFTNCLAAILEKTDRKNPDNTYLIKAKRAMEAALTCVQLYLKKLRNFVCFRLKFCFCGETSESRRQTDSYAMIFKLSSEVERCPASLLRGKDEWVKIRNKRMPIFLFNDLIEINVRTGNDDSSTPTRRSFSNYSFTRQLSLSALWYGKKNSSIYLLPFVEYKVLYTLICSFSHFKLARVNIFGTLLENQEGKLEKFLREVADQVYKLVGRNTLVEKVDFDEDHL